MSAFCLPLYERNRKTGKSYQICLSISEYSLPSEYVPGRYCPNSSAKSRSSGNVHVELRIFVRFSRILKNLETQRCVRCIVIGKNTSSVTIVALVLKSATIIYLDPIFLTLYGFGPTIWFFINVVHVTRDFLWFFGF